MNYTVGEIQSARKEKQKGPTFFETGPYTDYEDRRELHRLSSTTLSHLQVVHDLLNPTHPPGKVLRAGPLLV